MMEFIDFLSLMFGEKDKEVDIEKSNEKEDKKSPSEFNLDDWFSTSI